MTVKTTLSDGTAFSGEPELVAHAKKVDARMQREQRVWVAFLRQLGIKAAHPDDGWVDRLDNTIYLQYPQFNDGMQIGDLLALGSSGSRTRVVRVTGTVEIKLMGGISSMPYRYTFEEVCVL